MPNLNLQTIKDAIGSLLGQSKEEGAVDAIDMLKQDHKRVEQLGKDFQNAEDNSEKKSIATKILLELTVHAKLEEELVYPLLEKIARIKPEQTGSNGSDGKEASDEQREMSQSPQQGEKEQEGEEDEEEKQEIDEAYVEHHMVKLLIGELEHANPGDKQYDARVKVLIEMVKHHVKEEESELLPRLRASGEDMQALGEKLSKRKQQLLQQLEKRPRMSGNGKAAPSKAATKAGASSRSKSSAKSAAPRAGRKPSSNRAKSTAGKAAKSGGKATTAKKTGKAKASNSKVSARSSAAKAKTQKGATSSGVKAKSKAGTAKRATATGKSTTTAKKSASSKAKSRKR